MTETELSKQKGIKLASYGYFRKRQGEYLL